MEWTGKAKTLHQGKFKTPKDLTKGEVRRAMCRRGTSYERLYAELWSTFCTGVVLGAARRGESRDWSWDSRPEAARMTAF